MINFKNNHFFTRLISSLLMLPLMYLVWHGGPLLYFCIITSLFGMFFEAFYMLENKNRDNFQKIKIYFLCVLGVLPLMLFLIFQKNTYFLFIYLIFFGISYFYFMLNLLSSLFILLIVVSGFSCILISNLDSKILFCLFLIVFMSDIAAYVFGTLMRGPKLLPQISPQKTWSGAFSAILISVVVSVYLLNIEKLYLSILIGVLISIFAQVGDLFESLFKRTYGFKDSGKIIPGHGGLLDRFDGLLLNLPFILLLLKLKLIN